MILVLLTNFVTKIGGLWLSSSISTRLWSLTPIFAFDCWSPTIISIPKSSDSVSCSSSRSKTRGRLTRKDLRLHKLVFQDDALPNGTELAYFVRGQDGHLKMLGGYLEFFMKPSLADTYLRLKNELEELIQMKFLSFITEIIDRYFRKLPRWSCRFAIWLDMLQAIKEEIDVRPSRKSLDFLLGACVSAKDASSLLIYKEYRDGGLPYNSLTFLRQDRFDPIADSNTVRNDLIPHMVYGRNVRDQEREGSRVGGDVLCNIISEAKQESALLVLGGKLWRSAHRTPKQLTSLLSAVEERLFPS
ncbi:DExH-box ATP-dependent RNA helicase DExH3 [Camellia lanceoleosa]|nr:DExH-box ATP-dependent RNA helicase DExH3 [Camellia lanceoleosa]